VQVASFTYDTDGCVATVDVLPALSDVEVEHVAPRLIALLHDHLHRR
jgi:hypothetical protein